MGILPELFFSFARIGAFTFGGGYAMLSLLEHECVEKKQWLTTDEMAEVTVIAESTPGPIAINCATYTGLKQAGMKGALTATLGMVLPSFLVLLLISAFLQNAKTITAVAKALKGIRVAVVLLIPRVSARNREMFDSFCNSYCRFVPDDELRTAMYNKKTGQMKARLKAMGIDGSFIPDFKEKK